MVIGDIWVKLSAIYLKTLEIYKNAENDWGQ